jgi:hypothetical protein
MGEIRRTVMSIGRAAATIAAAFVVSQVLAIAIHGFILAPDYAPFYGTLLRSQDGGGAWQMLLLPVAHLVFISTIVWFYSRLRLEGTRMRRGLVLGTAAWAVGQIPHWLLWYAEQPWPGDLVLKQLGLELVASLIIGLTITAVAGDLPVAGAPRKDRVAVYT